jgi:hypothetical protein
MVVENLVIERLGQRLGRGFGHCAQVLPGVYEA